MPAAALAAPVPTTTTLATTTATTATTTATETAQQAPAPTPMRRRTDGVYGQLNTEWDHLTRSRTAHQQMIHWATTEPALVGLRQLADLTDTRLSNSTGAATRSRVDLDQTLVALLRLHHAGDRLAGRAVLQLMLGDTAGVINRTGTHEAHNHEEHRLHVVSCLWEAIATYPADKATPSASNRLALDTVKLVTDRADRADRSAGLDHLSDPEDFNNLPATTYDSAAADERVLLLVHWGVRHGHITSAEARLVFDYHSPTQRHRMRCSRQSGLRRDGVRSADLAAREQVTRTALRQRVSRITRRLTTAAREAAMSGDPTLTALAS